ncbi:MAG TPA: sensor histidine kinase [Anaerolineaceae bacterium]|nr:sensor histidine kinase [Anaerolineaceae bacterium]
MNENGERAGHSAVPAGSTIRAQLIWASLFPLVLFGLLATLAISAALNRMMLDQVTRRNTAQVEAISASLSLDEPGEKGPSQRELSNALQSIDPVDGSRLDLIDAQGELIASSDPNAKQLAVDRVALVEWIHSARPASRLMESSANSDELMASYAALPGENRGVFLTEPWAEIRLPGVYYQLILAGLLAIGTIFSLGMLSLSIGRITRPIAVLAENATRAVPGSIFHPVSLRGPREIRQLIDAFNQMVIRLAEQQSTLRQYAHKALLSQEEERQRLSHELHDGTLQDLLSLAQRVELCRNELERDPQQANRRLDELHRLIEQSIDDVRRMSTALRPPVLEDLGLAVALESLCKDLKQDRPAVQYEYEVRGEARRLSPDLELAVYRVVQEALANVRKHAPDATRVQVELIFGEAEIRAEVVNDGAGFPNQDVRALVRSGHLGLAGMYERARLFGGTLEISTDDVRCTTVTLCLPCFADLRLEEDNR